jgi:hypothetical protein
MGIVAWLMLGSTPDVWRFQGRAQATGGRRHPPDRRDAGPARDDGLWRGPSEARWIAQLLHGAPPPRGSALEVVGLLGHS